MPRALSPHSFRAAFTRAPAKEPFSSGRSPLSCGMSSTDRAAADLVKRRLLGDVTCSAAAVSDFTLCDPSARGNVAASGADGPSPLVKPACSGQYRSPAAGEMLAPALATLSAISIVLSRRPNVTAEDLADRCRGMRTPLSP